MDKEKELLFHASTTVRQQAIRLLISLAPIMGFRIWLEDVYNGIYPGGEKILGKMYVRGQPEFHLESNELLEILRPLYGLADSGDYWHVTFLRHLKEDLFHAVNLLRSVCILPQSRWNPAGDQLRRMSTTNWQPARQVFEEETLHTAKNVRRKSLETSTTLRFAGFNDCNELQKFTLDASATVRRPDPTSGKGFFLSRSSAKDGIS